MLLFKPLSLGALKRRLALAETSDPCRPVVRCRNQLDCFALPLRLSMQALMQARTYAPGSLLLHDSQIGGTRVNRHEAVLPLEPDRSPCLAIACIPQVLLGILYILACCAPMRRLTFPTVYHKCLPKHTARW